MKNMKLFGILAAFVLVCSGIQAGAVNIPSINIDYDRGIITISGEEDTANTSLNICILNPGKTSAEINIKDNSVNQDIFAFVGGTETDDNGRYCVPIRINSYCTAEEKYNLIISSSQSKAETDFSYIDFKSLLDAIKNEKDADILSSMLIGSCESLDIVLPDFIKNYDSSQMKLLAEYIISVSDSIVSVSTLRKVIYDYAFTTEIKKASAIEVQRIAEENCDKIGIDVSDEYYKGLGSNLILIYELMKKNSSGLYSTEDIKKLFNECEFIVCLKLAENKSQVEDYTKRFASALDKDTYEQFYLLSKSQMDKASGIIVTNAEKLENAQQIDELYLKAIKDAKCTAERSVESGGVSSGGSGGVGKATVVTAEKQKSSQIFDDISSCGWAAQAISELYAKKIITGTGEKKFSPSREIKREEFVKIICNVFKISGGKASFSDVEPGSWYEPYVAAAYSSNIINGVENGLFGTGKCISRGDACVIMMRCIEKYCSPDKTLMDFTFTDDASIAEYARESIKNIAGLSIINGYPDGSFMSQKSLTRAETAAAVYRLIQTMEVEL